MNDCIAANNALRSYKTKLADCCLNSLMLESVPDYEMRYRSVQRDIGQYIGF